MPRKPRFNLPGIPQHVVQRGNNRSPCFFEEQDYRQYLDDLEISVENYQCRVHAYVLMTNHVHLLVSPCDRYAIAQMMQALGRRYVYYVNHRYKRTGTLWEGRYRSSLVDSEAYLLACMRYIELNPVRAGMVEHPSEYRWSSFRANAHGETNELLDPHPVYLAMDQDDQLRQQAYRELFLSQMEAGLIDEIRDTLNHELVLGRSRFKDLIEQETGRQARLGKPGRPASKDQVKNRS